MAIKPTVNYPALAKALGKKLMSTAELASHIQISANTVTSVLNGKPVRLDSLRKILVFLGYTPEVNPFITDIDD
jgi:DNA-binding Xre family transcriptional regulator